MVPDSRLERKRLSSWKEIAAYLDTSVRTVQRWESLDGLPVYRNEHSKSGRVYAFESELDAWRDSRRTRLVRERRRTPIWLWLSIALALCAVMAAAVLWNNGRGNIKEATRVVRLTTVPGAKFAPAFSPDGDQVSFAWDGGASGQDDVYVQKIGSGEPRRLTTNGGRNSAWSPDGNWIAFLRRDTSRDFVLVVISPAGGAERHIARIRTWGAPPYPRLEWSPDSRGLVVPDVSEEGGPQRLVLVSAATGEKRTLTDPPAGQFGDSSPAWSPNGSLLAFSRHKDSKVSDLNVLSLTGAYQVSGQPRQITNNGHWNDYPAWSPDGRELIYVSDCEQPWAAWRVPAREGGKPERLAFLETPVSEPAISRRSGRLAFVRRRTDSNLWAAHLSDPSAPAPRIFAPSTEDDHSPAFSPSGDRVALFRCDQARMKSGCPEVKAVAPFN